jgi:hypothetical protein
MDRKTFIHSIARWSVAGTLLAITGVLLTRKQIGHGGNCRPGSPCAGCPDLEGCDKAEARKFKSKNTLNNG